MNMCVLSSSWQLLCMEKNSKWYIVVVGEHFLPKINLKYKKWNVRNETGSDVVSLSSWKIPSFYFIPRRKKQGHGVSWFWGRKALSSKWCFLLAAVVSTTICHFHDSNSKKQTTQHITYKKRRLTGSEYDNRTVLSTLPIFLAAYLTLSTSAKGTIIG